MVPHSPQTVLILLAFSLMACPRSNLHYVTYPKHSAPTHAYSRSPDSWGTSSLSPQLCSPPPCPHYMPHCLPVRPVSALSAAYIACSIRHSHVTGLYFLGNYLFSGTERVLKDRAPGLQTVMSQVLNRRMDLQLGQRPHLNGLDKTGEEGERWADQSSRREVCRRGAQKENGPNLGSQTPSDFAK